MSTLRPLLDHILVRCLDPEAATAAGLIIPDSARERPQQGEVIAVGEGRRLTSGQHAAIAFHAGDRILFTKHAGNEATLDGIEYLILREEDVLGVLRPTPGLPSPITES